MPVADVLTKSLHSGNLILQAGKKLLFVSIAEEYLLTPTLAK
jgi:hypothetical protein